MKQSRRAFVKTSLAATAVSGAPSIVRGKSPNAKIQHAAIGVGGMGWRDLQAIAHHPTIEITAICDIDEGRLAKAAVAFPGAKRYTDWRTLLANEGSSVDSVNVSTPDHMHAPITFTAMESGKHVYCQKPLTRTVGEARALRDSLARNKVVTQMGNQNHATIEYRMATQLLRDGVIGKVKEVHAWCDAVYSGAGRPNGEDPVPAGVDWDAWLGVAPYRPYLSGDYYHPFHWRCWQDFGGGCLGDFGCHILDTPHRALGLGAPLSVMAEPVADWVNNKAARTENWPSAETVFYVFPGTEFTAGETLPVTWYDGASKPSPDLFPFGDDEKPSIPGRGALFIGTDGVLLLPHTAGPRLLPREENRGIKRPKLAAQNHYLLFVDAINGGEPTSSNFEYAGNLTETVHLGTIACRVPGTDLRWDAKGLQFPGSAEANRLVTPTYREGWSIDGLG